MTELLMEKDLRVLMELVGAGREDAPTRGIPWAAMAGLRTLIGCDAVSFCELDLPHHNTLTFQGTDGEFIKVDMGDADDPYWEVSRGFLPCEYHEKGDHLTAVVKYSDFYTMSELRNTPFMADELAGGASICVMIAAMPTAPGRTRRVMLWRDGEKDFSERDRLIMQILRPHLYELYLGSQRRLQGIPRLSRREVEVLTLAAQGRGNADIARELFISVSTVRKHMEHIFDRTGVRTRTEAAAIVLPHLSVVTH